MSEIIQNFKKICLYRNVHYLSNTISQGGFKCNLNLRFEKYSFL